MDEDFKSLPDQASGEPNSVNKNVYYDVVNRVVEQSKLGTKYSAPQIALYKALVSTPHVTCGLKSFFSIAQKQKTVKDLIRDGWLCSALDNNVGLGVRSFLDLQSWFCDIDAPSCYVCNEAAT